MPTESGMGFLLIGGKKDVQLGSKVSKCQTAWKDGEARTFSYIQPSNTFGFFQAWLNVFLIFTNACLSVCLYHMCTWYPHKAEVGTRYPETGVRHGCEGLCGY